MGFPPLLFVKATRDRVVIIQNSINVQIESITIPSQDDVKKLPQDVLGIGVWWWLRDHGKDSYHACDVDPKGIISDRDHTYTIGGVRPLLIVKKNKCLRQGDVISLAGYKWTMITGTKALCRGIVTESVFKQDPKALDACCYDTSDLKTCLEKWWKNVMEEKGE